MSRRWTASSRRRSTIPGPTLADIDAIAATAGPGLVGGLIVGLMTAKAMAAAAGKPLLAINHLEGHALTARLTDGLDFPYLLLLVSGGHTQIVLVRGVGDYQRWATTIDDALGEAFDKTAKMLGLPYPGGPNVEKAAAGRRSQALRLPAADEGLGATRFLLLRPEDGGAAGGDGGSAAVGQGRRRHLRLLPGGGFATRWPTASGGALRDSGANFPTSRRRRWSSPAASPPTGRSAPRSKRSAGKAASASSRRRMQLCTDNAAMIAWAGIERIRAGLADDDAFDFVPRSRWPLDEVSAPVVGSGRRGAKA